VWSKAGLAISALAVLVGLYLTLSSFDVPAQDWQQMPPQMLAQYRQTVAAQAKQGQVGQGLLAAGVLGLVGFGVVARQRSKRVHDDAAGTKGQAEYERKLP
jgi:hypothetical protein